MIELICDFLPFYAHVHTFSKGEVEDTRLEAKAKDTKKSEAKAKNSPSEDRPYRGQGQTLSRPRTGMLEAEDQGHKRKYSQIKKSSKFFSRTKGLETKDFKMSPRVRQRRLLENSSSDL